MANTEFPQPPAWVRERLRAGLVIPAHPLALTDARRWDERRQREELAQFERLFPAYPQAPAGEPSEAEMGEINATARKHRRRLTGAQRRTQ